MRPSITWLLPDPHFFHNRMVQACGRPPDFTELIARNCRHLVAAQDVLICLGDVIFYHPERLKDILDGIPGLKWLTLGNHDRKHRGWYRRNGFHFVADGILLGDVYLTHKPCPALPAGARINIHGHEHNTRDRIGESPFKQQGVHRLVALEYTNYKPVNMAKVVACQDLTYREPA